MRTCSEIHSCFVSPLHSINRSSGLVDLRVALRHNNGGHQNVTKTDRRNSHLPLRTPAIARHRTERRNDLFQCTEVPRVTRSAIPSPHIHSRIRRVVICRLVHFPLLLCLHCMHVMQPALYPAVLYNFVCAPVQPKQTVRPWSDESRCPQCQVRKIRSRQTRR